MSTSRLYRSRVSTMIKLLFSLAAHTQATMYLCMVSMKLVMQTDTGEPSLLNQPTSEQTGNGTYVNASLINNMTTESNFAYGSPTVADRLCDASTIPKTLGLIAGIISSLPSFFFFYKVLNKKATTRRRLLQLFTSLFMLPSGMLNGEISAKANRYLLSSCESSQGQFYLLRLDLMVKIFCTCIIAFSNSVLLLSHANKKITDLRYLFNLLPEQQKKQHQRKLTCYFKTIKQLTESSLNDTTTPTREPCWPDKKLKRNVIMQLAMLTLSGAFMWMLACHIFYDYAYSSTKEHLTATNINEDKIESLSKISGHLAWHSTSLTFSLLFNDTFLLPRRPDLFSNQRVSTAVIILFLSLLTSLPYFVIFMNSPEKTIQTAIFQGSSFVLMSLLFTSYALIDPINQAYNWITKQNDDSHCREALTKKISPVFAAETLEEIRAASRIHPIS